MTQLTKGNTRLQFNNSTLNIIPVFSSTWDTTKVGTSTPLQIQIPFSTFIGDTVVYWGDGSNNTYTSSDSGSKTHTYLSGGVYKVTIKGKFNCFRFNNTGDKLKIINISSWGSAIFSNTSLFYGCSNLDITATNAPKIQTTLSLMFALCTSLTSLDMSKWDTSSVTTMFASFVQCTSLTTINVSNLDISSVESLRSTFFGCSSLETLDVSNWDTSSVTDMRTTFKSCTSLGTLDVSKWNISLVTTLEATFMECPVTTLDVSEWNTSSVESLFGSFYDCTSLETLDVSEWDTSSVTDMTTLFYGCNSLTILDVTNWNTSLVQLMGWMFANCYSLTTANLSSWNISNVTDLVNFMDSANLWTDSQYDDVLLSWSQQTVKPNLVVNFADAHYQPSSLAAKTILTTSPNLWTITDGGPA